MSNMKWTIIQNRNIYYGSKPRSTRAQDTNIYKTMLYRLTLQQDNIRFMGES